MKKLVINLLSELPFIQKYFNGMITIFYLHRVHPIDTHKLFPNENMKISPQFLENFILDLKSEGYQFISMDDAYQILQHREEVSKCVIFTLDDGYIDNYTIAYPIFKKHNVPFTIYVTTSFPERTAILWWYILENIILHNDYIKLSNGKTYECKSKKSKEAVFLEIRKIILNLKKDVFLQSLNELFGHYKIDWFRKNEELCMSWDQIIELSKDELCTIGGHTKNHYALNKLSKEEVISEILDANNLIEEKIKRKIEHVAYPFGSRNEVGQREFQIVKNLGIKTATTTRFGPIYSEHKNYLECLPRIMLTENFDMRNIAKIRRNKVVTV